MVKLGLRSSSSTAHRTQDVEQLVERKTGRPKEPHQPVKNEKKGRLTRRNHNKFNYIGPGQTIRWKTFKET